MGLEFAAARAARPDASTPARAPWRTEGAGEAVALGPLVLGNSRPLAAVLETRASCRAFAAPSLADLATILVRAGRVAATWEAPDGYVASHRPVPSAGARHPFDLHVLVRQASGLAAGTWIFDPVRCTLHPTETDPAPALAKLGDALGTAEPPAAVVLVARLQRTLSRYVSGLSLLWRDAGVLLASLHLVATDIGAASCIAGTCGILIDDLPDAIDVGALAVGAHV